MYRKFRKQLSFSAALVVFAILLQGCSSSLEKGLSDPSESPVATKPHTYNPALSPVFAQPWPTNVTRQELIDTALFKSFEFLDTLPKGPCSVEVNTYFQDSWAQEQVDLVENTSRRMIELFCDYLSEDVHVIGGSYDFVKETVAREGLPQDQYGGVCGYDVSDDAGTACAANGVAWIGPHVGNFVSEKFVAEPTRVTNVTHELFHIVHDDIDSKPGPSIPGPGDPLFRPVWLFEGAGQYWGSIIPKYFGLQDYQTYPPFNRSGLFLDVSYLSDLKSMEVWQERIGGGENYYSGLIAHEYIAASIGLEPLLEIWVRMDEGESFEQAFEKVTNLSVEQFYEKFSEMHNNLYEDELVE